MPRISVLIPVHNVEKTLAETLSSLCRQTFRDFDVVLVDDASTDGTRQVAESFRGQLAIRELALAENQGVAGALAQGLTQIDAPYVARLDGDDIAHPRRLELQAARMEEDPALDVCSSQIGYFNGEFVAGASLRVLSHPVGNHAIKTALIQFCSLVHGSAIFKRSFFEDLGGYDRRYDFAEDYDLWCRGALLGKRYGNIAEILTFVRKHEGQVSRQKVQIQYERDLAIKRKYIAALLGGDSPGMLPEFFSLQSAFVSREAALSVIADAFPVLMRLGNRVLDREIYAEIVSGCLRRHLGASGA